MAKGLSRSFRDGLENDPVLKQLQKVREDNARRQDHDYSHVFRKKSRFDLIRLSFIIMGIEFAYSAETAFVSPILLAIGVEHRLMTMVWALSPLFGFFISPIMGTISDRCRSSLGRRRPFMIALSISLALGLILVPYGENLGALLGDEGETVVNANGTEISFTMYDYYKVEDDLIHEMSFKWAIIFTVIGTIMLDFSADVSQTPSRTYLLDVCVPEDQPRALSTFSILGGIGGSLGYALGGIDWTDTTIGDYLGGNIKTVFCIVTVVFIISSILTITSFREVPLPLMEQDEFLRPITQAVIKKEKQRINDKIFYIKEVSKSFAMQLHFISDPNTPCSTQVSNTLAQIEKGPQIEILEDSDIEEHEVTITEYLKSIVIMPKSMRILCLTNLLCWMSHLCYALYFTDFVGEAVFLGDPAAPMGSEEYSLFEDGVRFGCWGMALYSLACSVYAWSIEYLIKVLRARTVYVGGLLIDSFGMCMMALWPTKVSVLIFSVSGGIVYAILFTLPYMLIAQYHSKGSFNVKEGVNVESKHQRGLGTDVAIVGGMLFVAQIIVSLGIGAFITLLGSTTAVIYGASLCSLLAAIVATRVVYMDL